MMSVSRGYKGVNGWGKGFPVLALRHCRAPWCALAPGLLGNSAINRRVFVPFAVSHDHASLTDQASVFITFCCLVATGRVLQPKKIGVPDSKDPPDFLVPTEICEH